jgi:CRP-like cAMP-binding protein
VNALAFLRNNQALAAAEPALLRELAERCTIQTYDRGARIATAGSRQTHILLVAKGSLTLWRRHAGTKNSMLFGMLGPPALLGDAELFTRSPWIATLRAAEPTVVVHIPNQEFERFVARAQRVAEALYRDASARHMLVMRIMQMFVLEDMGQRIMSLLASHAVTVAPDRPREAKMSHTVLADALGVHRKTIARHLNDMAASGLIQRKGKTITLLFDDAVSEANTSHGFGASWALPVRGRG